MKSKTGLILVFIIIGLIFSVSGFSYAWYNYTREGTNNELIAGNIYLTMDEGSEQLNISGVFPTTVSEARSKDNNFITFTLNGINESDRTIYYEIKLDHGDEKDQPYERFLDSEIHFDLIEIDEDGNELEYLLYNMTFDNFENKRIWVDTVDANTTTEVVKRYKLRAWLDENIIISDTEANATYPSTGARAYKNHYASIKVSVFGDFQVKNMDYGFAKMKQSINHYKIVNNCTPITTANNNAGFGGDGNVTYFSGSESCVNFNYVWYSGKLWRITAIYPDGTMKLVTENPMTTLYRTSSLWTPGFNNSHLDQWLNQEFLPALYNYENIIVQDAEWNITKTTASTDPYLMSNSSILHKTVGLLNKYDYSNAGGESYLNIGQYLWLMNTNHDFGATYATKAGYAAGSGGSDTYSDRKTYGIRPSIYLKTNVKFSNVNDENVGKRSNPYRIVGDKNVGVSGENINSRMSGEYVQFDGKLYRIVDIEDNKTKIVSTVYATNSSTSSNLAPFGTDRFYNTPSNDSETWDNTYWDNYLKDYENGWLSTLSTTARSMLDDGTYYLGYYTEGSSYKSTICANVSSSVSTKNCTRISNSSLIYVGKVGLLRVGEMFSANQSTTTHQTSPYTRMWLISPISESSSYVNYVHVERDDDNSVDSTTNSYAVRPTVYLKSNVVIKNNNGDGTVFHPYEIELQS